jgi:hypothetical protein
MSKIAKFGGEMLQNSENIALQGSHILYTLVLRAEIATTFGPKMVTISACNIKVYKICELCKAIFSAFYNISQPNFVILLFLAVVICILCLVLKLVYNGNCLSYCYMYPRSRQRCI